MPAASACCSLSPAAPIAGLVKVTLGQAGVVDGAVSAGEGVLDRQRAVSGGDVDERRVAGHVARRPHSRVGRGELIGDGDLPPGGLC